MTTTPLDFVAIDFETATLQHESACAIGIVTVKNGHIIEKYYTLIKPPYNKMSSTCIECHGITPDQTANAPVFAKIYPEIQRRLQDQVVIAHNAYGFDSHVLTATMKYYSIPDTLNITWFDTLEEYPMALNIACEENNIPLDHHDALSDATACALLHLLHLQRTTPPAPKERRKRQQPSIDPQFNTPDNPFINTRIVLSGQFTTWPDRDDLTTLLRQLGARTSDSVSNLTNILVIGNEAGPRKIQRMQENIDSGKDARILTEAEIIQLLLTIGAPVPETKNQQ